jgi:hypothetical protein
MFLFILVYLRFFKTLNVTNFNKKTFLEPSNTIKVRRVRLVVYVARELRCLPSFSWKTLRK